MIDSTGFDLERLIGAKIPGRETGVEIHKTICDICNVYSHCGIDAYVKDGVVVKVEGTRENPNSEGTLCSKGNASRQYIYHKDRIRTPLIRKGGRENGHFVQASWDEALDLIAKRLLEIRKESGPESVVFLTGYPKWMRPFLKRLAHNYGSPNFCTESSVCFFATFQAVTLNYGAMGGPDFANSNCLLAWSRNPFHTSTPIVRKLLDARERGMKIIDVGPLVTPLTAHADIHLRIRPGTSGALALGFARVIIEEGLYDREFVENYTIGFEEYRAYADQFTPAVTEDITGVSAGKIVEAARLFATTKPASLMFSSNATVHHTNGLQNHRAVTALVGLTGNYDVPGGNLVLPMTFLHVSSPGLATREHEFEQPRSFDEMPPRIGQDVYPAWCRTIGEGQSMHIPHQIQSGKPYPIKAIVGFGFNHRMWPGSDFMADSLKKLDFVVDVDLFMTDTARQADVVLPACTSFERSELKFYPQRHVIWTEPAVRPLGDSRSDVEIIFDLAKRITPEDKLMQKGYEACIDWILEPAKLTIETLKKFPAGYTVKDAPFPPFRKYRKDGFATPSGKMEFTSTILKETGYDPLPVYKEPRLSPRSTPEVARDFPLIFTTGSRLPMFIHSRTFRLDWTRSLRPDPMVDMNPEDARDRGIAQEDWVSLFTRRGAIKVRANLTERVPPGVVSMYHGYPEANVNLLIEPDYLDPISGYPGFKSLLCQVKKITDVEAK